METGFKNGGGAFTSILKRLFYFAHIGMILSVRVYSRSLKPNFR